jgi:hypothetical protein
VSADPYLELGVSRTASDAEIRAAYEQAVTSAVRDGLVDNAKRADAAYEVLRHPSRRLMFDRAGVVHELRRPEPAHGFYAAEATPGRTWSPDEQPAAAPTRAASRRRAMTVPVLVGMVLAITLVARLHAHRAGDSWSFSGDLAGVRGAPSSAPPVTRTAHPQRLLPAVTQQGAGGYTLDADARWDPCRPIRYVVSGAEPFAGADAMLTQALDEAGAASGLQFVNAGTTTEPASPARVPYQPERYGRSWAPVLVAWTDEAHVPDLAGNVIGLGGAVSATVHGSRRLVSGVLYFDQPELFLIAQRGTGYASMRTVMLHEIGHLLGLGHVQDPGAVMYPSDRAQGDYAAGDLRGLAYAGAAPCSQYS